MLRRKQVLGLAVISFGLGMLVGCGFSSAFWCCALGLGGVAFGFLLLQKK